MPDANWTEILVDEDVAIKVIEEIIPDHIRDSMPDYSRFIGEVEALFQQPFWEDGIPLEEFITQVSIILGSILFTEAAPGMSVGGPTFELYISETPGLLDDFLAELEDEFDTLIDYDPEILSAEDWADFLTGLTPEEQRHLLANMPPDTRSIFLTYFSDKPELLRQLDEEFRVAYGLPDNEGVQQLIYDLLEDTPENEQILLAKVIIAGWYNAPGKVALRDQLQLNIDAMPEDILGVPIAVKDTFIAFQEAVIKYEAAIRQLNRRVHELENPEYFNFGSVLRLFTRNSYAVQLGDRTLNNLIGEFKEISPYAELILSVLYEPADWLFTIKDVYQDIKEGDTSIWTAVNVLAAVAPFVSSRFLSSLDDSSVITEDASKIRRVIRYGDDEADFIPARVFNFAENSNYRLDDAEDFMTWILRNRYSGNSSETLTSGAREIGAYVDADGRLVAILAGRGEVSNITLPADFQIPWGGIFTHIHPVDSAFSRFDIASAIRENLSQMRILSIDEAGNITLYTLNRPDIGGWRAIFDKPNESIRAALQRLAPRTQRIVNRIDVNDVNNFSRAIEEAVAAGVDPDIISAIQTLPQFGDAMNYARLVEINKRFRRFYNINNQFFTRKVIP